MNSSTESSGGVPSIHDTTEKIPNHNDVEVVSLTVNGEIETGRGGVA